METRTKIILALVGAGVATLVIYVMAKKRTAVSQMQPAVVPPTPVPVINYNNSKPVMGLSAFRDGDNNNNNNKPNMKDVVFEQRLQSQSD